MKKLTVLTFILMALSLWISYDRVRMIKHNHQMMIYWISDYAYVQSVEKLKTAISQGRSSFIAPGTHLLVAEPIVIPRNAKDMNFVGGVFEASKDFPEDKAMIEIGR